MAEYYMPTEADGLLTRLWRRASKNQRPRPRFPRALQIQTNSRCNAACLFCGYTEIKDELPHGVMDMELFRKIVDEIPMAWTGRVSPYLMNEPLLDKTLPEKIAYITARRRLARTKINSNGALLTPEMSQGLVDARLRHLWISVQGIREETYKRSMGLNLPKVLENIDAFLAIRERAKADLPKLTITMLNTALVQGELEEAKAYWAERGVRLKVHNLDNRSGKDLSELKVQARPILRRNCDLFLKQAYILYNGDVILCCHDWRRSVVLGNVRENTLAEIWNSERFLELIRQYQAGDFTNLAICRGCTVT